MNLVLGVGLAVTPLSEIAQADAPTGLVFETSPTPISQDIEVQNPMRGQYLWYGSTKSPDLTGPDSYDRMFWNEVETADQVFDTWKIDAGLAAAEATGGTYGFRIMAICDGCSDDMVILPPQLRQDAGTWIAQGDSGPLEIPDWNSEEFLSQWEELMTFLGQRYAEDPRLGWIDVGGYGNWGEWHSYPFEGQYPGPIGQTDITLASSMRLIDAVAMNFPNTPILLNTTSPRLADVNGDIHDDYSYEWSNQLWQEALAIDDRIGVRNDCLGAGLEQSSAKAGLLEASRYAQETGGLDPLERWKTAPFITEYCWATKPPVDIDGNGVIDEWERHDYNGDGIVEDWELESDYGSFDNALEQVEDWHISLTSSDNFGGELAEYPEADQEAFRQAVLRSGYRYELTHLKLVLPQDSSGSVTWTWENVNVAPTYADWEIVLEFRPAGSDEVAASVTSALDLRDVLPGAPVVYTDAIPADALEPGKYDIYVKVIDPNGYFAPLALAIAGQQDDGSYLIAQDVTIAPNTDGAFVMPSIDWRSSNPVSYSLH